MTSETEFNITQGASSLFIQLSSTLENVDRVAGLTRTFLDERGHGALIFSAGLVLREGLTNAVKHAHRSDSGKLIQYRLELRDKLLFMEIEDQGSGFDWRKIASDAMAEDADHGRGLKIMRHYFTECRYNDAGNKLTLVKKID